MKVIWHGQIIAESKDVLIVDREYYFPPNAIDDDLLEKSKAIFYCAEKGYADQYHICVKGNILANSAWIYPHPFPQAEKLKGRVGFKKVMVSE